MIGNLAYEAPQAGIAPYKGLRHQALLTSDNPDMQVSDTVALMSEYVRSDWDSPEIQRDAREAVGQGQDPLHGIWWYVKERVRFQDDARTAAPLAPQYGLPIVEVLIRPRDMAVLCSTGDCKRIGDCDDFAMYTAALLRAHGIKSSFVTIAADGQHPERFSHVYVAAYPEGRGRVAMDVSHGLYPGWEAHGLGRIEEWPIFPSIWPLILALGLVAYLIIKGGRLR